MVNRSQIMSIITSSTNGQHALIQRQRLSDWTKKAKSNYIVPKRDML